MDEASLALGGTPAPPLFSVEEIVGRFLYAFGIIELVFAWPSTP